MWYIDTEISREAERKKKQMMSIHIFAQLNKRDMGCLGRYTSEPKLSLTCKNETGRRRMRYKGEIL